MTGSFKRNKKAEIDGLLLLFPNYDGEVLAIESAEILRLIWRKDEIVREWCESVFAPTFKTVDNSTCENEREISLLSTTRGHFFAGLSNAREGRTGGNQADLRQGQGCADYWISMRRWLEHKDIFRRLNISVYWTDNRIPISRLYLKSLSKFSSKDSSC